MELTELWMTLVRGLSVIAYGFLYSMGGIVNKLFRRILAPLVFGLAMLAIGGIKWEALSLLILIPPVWLGYGGGEYETRVVYAVINGLAGLFVCFIYGNNGMAFFQLILTTFATCYLGILNPVPARREEFLIGALSVVGIAFTI
jgi:hypothetical protein